ncbi:phenylalanine--tRNA ligase subunit alpha [Eubacterium callanderi]|uniref:Phenylalanine--tRNA ligase alpha subunit n=1 Tax=Eubacterium callanderi TaxID=53442 RepID=E3GNL2_9FIRM|nr:phenylalanine--tRNA ligase subunit alpha [Eubacterium callanderi]OEZ02893.1 phenylalanine--tRNA ligase alpha subunit [[Butyribacterium] methylotrophicum]ADO37197.1 phenylalanyl-tRNA synthetase subunit alpha [Eubacterium callanderi]MCB6659466.1 phenylalanine--tRNA ligase subunit alpha [Eubacterium callanderi]MCB6752345.1 phenylalanine--tRNA ligase subunit alpha [Eubacterium callanderi]MCB7104037.1 phenylalanine--tRNA ligase subunit alpha [Eubacterium callanderi]
MQEELNRIRENCLEDLKTVSDMKSLDDIRVKYLGKKGVLTAALKEMGKLSKDERPVIGKLANEVREEIETGLAGKKEALETAEMMAAIEKEKLDVSLPGKKPSEGNLHPLNIIINDLEEIFLGMGFSIAEGPEIEWSKYNFDYLNMPQEHSARDLQETFYYNDEVVLRTQTSPVQVRVMMDEKPPLRVISPGRVYRADEIDATHSPVFHQMEGLVIDKGITMADLKGTLDMFAKKLFGETVQTKFRPHQFYFTEPSAEMDVTCFKCGGTGCKVCGNSGWIELLGCGMVHPNVLRHCGIDPEVYSGFAFGMGLERVAMTKYGINDLRLLFENDMRFLTQFK